MELASCHISTANDLEMTSRFLEGLWAPGIDDDTGTRGYRKLKEQEPDHTLWRTCFGPDLRKEGCVSLRDPWTLSRREVFRTQRNCLYVGPSSSKVS